MELFNLFVLCFLVDFVQGDINEIVLKRETASSFHHRAKRSLYHECYREVCEFEEVREVYPYNVQQRWEYWYDYRCWKSGYACKVNCVYRQTCDLAGWSSWNGAVGSGYGCYTQTRYRHFKYAKETSQKRFNCNGLKTSCPTAPTEKRQVCVCRQAVCAPGTWSGWTPGITAGQCVSQSRRKRYTGVVLQKQNFGSCSGVPSSCPNDLTQTRRKCSCAKADCTLNSWSNWNGAVEQGKCSKQERKRTYDFSWAYEIHDSCPGNLPKSCPAVKIEERVKCSCRYAFCTFDKVWTKWKGLVDSGKCNQVQTRYRRYERTWAYEEHVHACPSLSQACPKDLSETRNQCMCEHRDSCETHPWSPWSNPVTQLGCKSQTRKQEYKYPLKKVRKENCDGLLTCKSDPVETRTYCQCEEAQCTLQTCWSAWRPQLSNTGCIRQRSSQEYKKSIRYIYRNGSCNGLNTDCPANNERNRTMCNCKYQTCSYSNWTEWQGEVPEESCTAQVRTKSISQTSHHMQKEENCDGLITVCSLPEKKETRKICNCRYREDCTLVDWGEWRGDNVTKLGSCSVQIRSRDFNNSVIVKQQLNNCDGLPKRCAVIDKEETRYKCRCLRQKCNWTNWYEDGVEEKTNCKLLSRVRNITISSTEVEVFGSCENAGSICNAQNKETVKKCGVLGKIIVIPMKSNSTEPVPLPPKEPVVMKYVPIGCYKDSQSNRALPQKIKNLRNDIDWHNMEKTVKGCVDYAAKLRYSYVGVQFYGECWSGEDSLQKYNSHGRSKYCWSGVGQDLTNFVYKIIELPESACTDLLKYQATFSSGEYIDGEWCTEDKEDKTPHLTLTFDVPHKVTGLATKGHDEDAFVTVYAMEYTLVGNKTVQYKENGIPKLFAEDSNRFTTEVHLLKIDVTAKILVFRPKQWQAEKLCMDLNVYGCAIN